MPTSSDTAYDDHQHTSTPPDRTPCSLRLGLLLVSVCFVPRLLRCLLADAVCPDAFLYFDQAAALEQGNLKAAFSGGMNLNLYPPILAALHQLGLDWVPAGRVWNLVITSATVLPLYGWVSRLTDARTASLACVVYAFWPFMIEISSEPIRDPTFWMLLNLTFYLGLRMIERPALTGGIVIAITWAAAVLTRMEGWLLLLPLAWWAVGRAAESQQHRRIMIRVGLAGIASMLLLAATVNLTIGRQAGTWITGRIETSLPGIPWLHRLLHGEASLRPDGRVSEHVEPTTLHSFTQNFVEGLDPLNLAALVLGLFVGRRLLKDARMRPLHAYAFLLMAAIWCRIPDQRYFCQVYFILIPYVAIGARRFIETIGDWLSQHLNRDLRRQWTIAWLSVFAVIGTCDAVATWYPTYQNNLRLAEWYRQSDHTDSPPITDRTCVPARFLMSGPQPGLPYLTHRNARQILEKRHPNVVVYSFAEQTPEAQELLRTQLTAYGYELLPDSTTGVVPRSFSVWINSARRDLPIATALESIDAGPQ